jgi:hypothetical protein
MGNRLRTNAIQLNKPQPLHGSMGQDGTPQTITRRGQTLRVESVQDSWRIDDEWWREHPISRLYYQLVLEGGTLFECYHDLVTGEWFVQRG